jgi:hypothetical protein
MKAELFTPQSYKSAPETERALVSNGCGAKGGISSWLVPNTLWGLSVKRACNIHDWMYSEGLTIADKEEADRVFLNNMLRIIEVESCWLLKLPRRSRAKKYYKAVKYFGGPAFWEGK